MNFKMNKSQKQYFKILSTAIIIVAIFLLITTIVIELNKLQIVKFLTDNSIALNYDWDFYSSLSNATYLLIFGVILLSVSFLTLNNYVLMGIYAFFLLFYSLLFSILTIVGLFVDNKKPKEPSRNELDIKNSLYYLHKNGMLTDNELKLKLDKLKNKLNNQYGEDVQQAIKSLKLLKEQNILTEQEFEYLVSEIDKKNIDNSFKP